MATQSERLAIVETKVANIEQNVVELKSDVKDLHDCLDRTRDLLEKKLDDMLDEYRENRDKYYGVLEMNRREAVEAHEVLDKKISNLEKIKTKATIAIIGVIAFIAGTGYLTIEQVAKVIAKLA